ncbi:Mediator of RNA polymerase II transcription subunit 14 [Penicillium diatomitis]|uniref:Mediator of RNA polymerase II transcription subunit 14 n=1 Tax=Penicillium diatomitis TaxID=2819901 RepID=A0A9W9WT55_9EURO|nr:Mediator of RNA polymerase II transcription subunit 14 [Penicillium diatomitis]KAJ5475041.1 Mediator of RNA polymerase II transcription subunit 14 [Penicillium diatomitis]
MENANMNGSSHRAGPNEAATHGALSAAGGSEKLGSRTSSNGLAHVNGTGRDAQSAKQHSKALQRAPNPFDIPHITQGFFPFGTLVHRAVQNCWNELTELISDLATVQVPQDHSSAPGASGKSAGNQSAQNMHKKLKILEWGHARRAEFIKLLVLSEWSRHAADVSRLIDIQGFIRTRHQAYMTAMHSVGMMKQDLVRAQVANPDLKTALEVLAKGRVASLPDFGYKPPKSLSPRTTLKKLHKINRIISARLILQDQVPYALRNYRIHDGRVTFTVAGEFELDLSVAQEAKTSQFFFVDIRFLFQPSSPIPKGRILDELEVEINRILFSDGLLACFNFLHQLVLTNKVNTLFRQAHELSHGLWSGLLHIELLHRTLVVQYWTARAGPKSWIEIGVRRGSGDRNSAVPQLHLRWMRDGQSTNSAGVKFDTDTLSMERILRSVIALHISHLLSLVYTTLKKNLLFANHLLSLRGKLSSSEPSDCYLTLHMTITRKLQISIEPQTGNPTLSGTTSVVERPEPGPQKPIVEEVLGRITRLRCASAMDEIESGSKGLGLEPVNPRVVGMDLRKLFPPNTVRSAFFTHHTWDSRWVVAATSSMDGDSWWLVQLRPEVRRSATPLAVPDKGSNPALAHAVSNTMMGLGRRTDHTACAELVYGLTGMLAIYANACSLAELPEARFQPSLEEFQFEEELVVPDLYIDYQPSTLPKSLQLDLPSTRIRDGSYLNSTIRLSYKGVDRNQNLAVLVAHGNFKCQIKSLPMLVSLLDPEIVVQNKGGAFALRLEVPAGQTAIFSLFERLQRLDCVIYLLQRLIRSGMEPRSMSLSQITFLYGTQKELLATFSVGVSGSTLANTNDVSRVISQSGPLHRLRLKISFDSPSPHRRIQEPLTVVLNKCFAEAGIDPVLALMAKTMSLLHSFDEIVKKPPQSETSLVYITTRGPTTYHMHFPRLRYRFRLTAHSRRGKTEWLLDDASRESSPEFQVVSAVVQEQIYKAKGDGWQGLGDGARASISHIGHLLHKLHDCLGTCAPVPEPVKQEGSNAIKVDPQVKFEVRPPLQPQQKPAPPSAVKSKHVSPKKKTTTGDNDVITID